jgi:hypothetical protein
VSVTAVTGCEIARASAFIISPLNNISSKTRLSAGLRMSNGEFEFLGQD